MQAQDEAEESNIGTKTNALVHLHILQTNAKSSGNQKTYIKCKWTAAYKLKKGAISANIKSQLSSTYKQLLHIDDETASSLIQACIPKTHKFCKSLVINGVEILLEPLILYKQTIMLVLNHTSCSSVCNFTVRGYITINNILTAFHNMKFSDPQNMDTYITQGPSDYSIPVLNYDVSAFAYFNAPNNPPRSNPL